MRMRWRLVLERACWATGLGCAVYLGAAWEQAHAAAHAVPGVAASASRQSDAGGVIGELRMSSLGLRVPVLGDDSSGSLLRGLGHIPGTAVPGGLGTVALAGHRDTFLRPLARVAPGMRMDVAYRASLYHYVVDRTEIVQPENVGVIATADTPELVLVTCYPFHYVGAAPLRFIVHAHLLSLSGEPLKPGL